MKVELSVVGIRNYCGGEDGYPQLFGRLPIGSEVALRINRPGEPFPGSVSVYDMEMHQIGSISKTERRFIEQEIPTDGVLFARVTEHSAEHNCILVEAENTQGIKEPYLRDIDAESGEIVFATTAQDARMVQLTDMVKSQLERLKEQDVTEQQMAVLKRVLAEYSQLCCASLDGESSFKRADILMYLRAKGRKLVKLQQFCDDIFERSKDLGRKFNDVKVKVYRQQYDDIRASAMMKGKNGKSQVDEWLDNLRFTHGGVLGREVVSKEMERLANLLSGELMGKYVSCIDSDEDFATALYSLNYRLRAIYVLYTRRIKYNHLKNILRGDAANAEVHEAPTVNDCQHALPLPHAIDTLRAQTYFKKAIDKGFVKMEGGKFAWIQIGNRGGNSQLAYFCGRVFEYEHSNNGNIGTSFPEEELNELFGVKRMYSSLTQVHNAMKIQPWRRKIDELFE